MKVSFVLLAVGLAAAADDDVTKRPSAPLRVTLKKPDDTVEVRAEMRRTVVTLKCPSGISGAVVERQGERWPEAVTLRLHLKGLESFRAANGKVTLEAAVSSNAEKPTARLWKDGKEDAPLDATSPYWMDIRKTDAGCFEMTLPRAFFEGNPKSITLSWIDFYRQ